MNLSPSRALVLLLLLCAALFGPVIATDRFYLWDASEQYWADLHYLCGALADGEWPRWNPYDRGGYSVLGDPQSGIYYPLNWLLCAGGRAPPMALAELRVALHFFLAGAGMLGFLRALGLPVMAALLGGVTFMLAPFQRKMWGVNPTYTLAYLPALLWAIELVRTAAAPRERAMRAAVVALLVGLAAAAGSPPALYYTLLGAGAYAVATLVRGPARAASAAAFALAALLAAGLCAIILVPAAQVTALSVQHGRDYASISAGGVPLAELATGWLWPQGAYAYFGLPAIALAVVGLVRKDAPLPRAARVCFAALAITSALLMLGDRTPVYRLLYHALPGVSLFRSPQRYSALLGCAVAVLAAGGAARLSARRRGLEWGLLALVLGALAIDLPADLPGVPGPPPGPATVLARLQARMGGADVANRFRVWDEFGLSLRSGTRFRIRDLRGYQDPLMQRRYEQVIGKLAEAPRMLEQWNVKYLLRGPHFIHGDKHHYLPAGSEPAFATEIGDGVWRTRAPLPAAYWVRLAALWPSGTEALLERLRAIAPRAVCFLEGAGPFPDTTTDLDAAEGWAAWKVAATTRIGRNTVDVDVTAPSSGWVVVAEVEHPGWHVTVDGQPAQIQRANWLQRAVHVSAGAHAIHFWYAPDGYPVLVACALAALALCLALIARARA